MKCKCQQKFPENQSQAFRSVIKTWIPKEQT